MYKTEKLKALVNERLKAAAEEIFSLFEKTIQDYQEEVFRSKQEIDNQRRLAGCNKAPLQLSVQEEEAPPEQEDCEKIDLCDVDQELGHIKEEHEELWTNQSAPLQLSVQEDDASTEPPAQIKEEHEELWTNQAGETLQEDDTKDSLFNVVYTERSDEYERWYSHSNQNIENVEGDPLPSTSARQKADPDPDYYVPELTSDYQMINDDSDDCQDSGGHPSATKRNEQQRAGETADKFYTCSFCNNTFKSKSTLMYHLKTHTELKPYSCSVCSKSFSHRAYLQTHMHSHSGYKPHICSFCGRGFTRLGNLNVHIRTHTGEKPYNCPDCSKSFREKADLINHTLIHTGEKPYSCNICNRKFNHQSNCRRHMKTHFEESQYSCTVCGKRFIRRSQLIIHLRTHTGETVNF